MLFFKKNNGHDVTNAHSKNKTEIKFAPLQVRRNCSRYLSVVIFLRKRALSWTSRTLGGSLSLEGAMCLSLFLFLSVCLIMPMRMMDRQRQIQGIMESVGEELSRYAYVEYCLKNTGEENVDTGRAEEGMGSLQGSGGEDMVSVLGTAYMAARILPRIDKSWIQDLSFDGTDIGTDDMIHIEMSYRMKLPFSVLGLDSIAVKQVCSRRMWTGAEGGRHQGGQGTGEGQEQEEMVYVGKSSTRYHGKRSCHYLYNNLEAVSAGNVDQLRNQAGARYTPCRTCGPGSGSGTVYIMPYGTSYHTQRSCRSIIAYVQEVPLSQVVHLGACSYCGGG